MPEPVAGPLTHAERAAWHTDKGLPWVSAIHVRDRYEATLREAERDLAHEIESRSLLLGEPQNGGEEWKCQVCRTDCRDPEDGRPCWAGFAERQVAPLPDELLSGLEIE